MHTVALTSFIAKNSVTGAYIELHTMNGKILIYHARRYMKICMIPTDTLKFFSHILEKFKLIPSKGLSSWQQDLAA